MNHQSSIRLHIERLVVDEPLVSDGQSGALQVAVETELSRLLKAGGFTEFPDSSTAILNAGSIHVPGKFGPASFGRQIAQSIHGALQPAGAAVKADHRLSNRSSS